MRIRSHEKTGRPTIKIARLEAEYGKLPPGPQTEAILESARRTIDEHEGNDVPALVAEGSMLAWLGESAIPFLENELEALPKESSDIQMGHYHVFLNRTLMNLQRAQIMRRTATTIPISPKPAEASSISRSQWLFIVAGMAVLACAITYIYVCIRRQHR